MTGDWSAEQALLDEPEVRACVTTLLRASPDELRRASAIILSRQPLTDGTCIYVAYQLRWLSEALTRQPNGAPVAADWRPIETAPRDGTRVLLADAERVCEGQWWSDYGGMWSTDHEPTHWMPRPPPPGGAGHLTR